MHRAFVRIEYAVLGLRNLFISNTSTSHKAEGSIPSSYLSDPESSVQLIERNSEF